MGLGSESVSGAGMADLVNAFKGNTQNTGALVQQFTNLASAISGVSSSTFAASGYIQLPIGLIINWGSGTLSAGTATVTYAQPFTTACYVALANITGSATATDNALIVSSSPGKTTCVVYGPAASAYTFFYIAIGK
jgi:hypothetical protein